MVVWLIESGKTIHAHQGDFPLKFEVYRFSSFGGVREQTNKQTYILQLYRKVQSIVMYYFQKFLFSKDKAMYKQNGILHMLERNRKIKAGPERLQNTTDQFDVIITAEERVYDQVSVTCVAYRNIFRSIVNIVIIQRFFWGGGN